jgi:hypothetical protein
MEKVRDGDFIDTSAFDWCKWPEEKNKKIKHQQKRKTYDVNIRLTGGILSYVLAGCSILLSVVGFLMMVTMIVIRFGI